MEQTSFLSFLFFRFWFSRCPLFENPLFSLPESDLSSNSAPVLWGLSSIFLLLLLYTAIAIIYNTIYLCLVRGVVSRVYQVPLPLPLLLWATFNNTYNNTSPCFWHVEKTTKRAIHQTQNYTWCDRQPLRARLVGFWDLFIFRFISFFVIYTSSSYTLSIYPLSVRNFVFYFYFSLALANRFSEMLLDPLGFIRINSDLFDTSAGDLCFFVAYCPR